MERVSIEQLLEEDHRSIGDLIAGLCEALEELDAERSFALLDLVWARLAVHIRAEHLCLFPALMDAARNRSSAEEVSARFDEAQTAINQLRHDHDFFMTELALAVNVMRAMNSLDAGGKQESLRDVLQTINAVRVRLEEHNRREEEEVYRWPAVVFDSSRQAQISDWVRHEIENMPLRFSQARAGAPSRGA
jgi:Hemerythrin HHE cation binding domain